MSVATLRQLPLIKRSFDSVFPLPLTTLESFMFADDRPQYPMMCDMEMQLAGRIDREAFERALAFALARNPLMTSLVERGPRGSLHWVPTERRPMVTWTTLDEPLDDRYGEFVDLTSDVGLRVWVREGEQALEGLAPFSPCVLRRHRRICLHRGSAGRAIRPKSPAATRSSRGRLIPRSLKHRGDVGITGRPILRRIVDSIIGSREGARFLLQSPRPLATLGVPGAAITESPPRPGFVTIACPQHVAVGLRRQASRTGATVNDVLMRDLFVVLRGWNREHESMAANRRLRILMPQNLRGPEESAMPAANVMSFAFVTRRADWCDKPAELLESIREETEAVRRGRLSLYFVGGLETLRSARLLSPVLNSQFCFATAVLTNLSNPTRRFVAPVSSCGARTCRRQPGVGRNRRRTAFAAGDASRVCYRQ